MKFIAVLMLAVLTAWPVLAQQKLSEQDVAELRARRAIIFETIVECQNQIARGNRKLVGAEASGKDEKMDFWKTDVAAWEERLIEAKEEIQFLDRTLAPYKKEELAEEPDPNVLLLPTAGETPVDDGLIAVGDTLEIIVTEDESFNGLYQVRRGGYVILPQIGRIMVAAKDQQAAEAAIREALARDLIRDATVLVELPELKPADEEELRTGDASLVKLDEIYLYGEWEEHDYLKDEMNHRWGWGHRYGAGVASVEAQAAQARRGGIARKRAPGLQVLPEGATVVKMILQWGTTDYADLENVKVLRLVGGKPLQEIVDVDAVLEGDDLASDMTLESGDIVIIPRKGGTNRIYITGAVAQSDTLIQLPHDEELTVYTAMIRAGGKDRFANLRRVFVLRDMGSGHKTRIDVDLKAVQRGEVPDLVMQSNDVIVIPEKFFSF